MKNEIWKDIAGYEGWYQVSNMGRVRSLDRITSKNRLIKGEIRKLSVTQHGYLNVSLNKNGVSKTYSVHKLVATAFLENPENKPCIDHIDTCKTNNKVENLRWVTHRENINNSLTKKHQKEAKKKYMVWCEELNELFDSVEQASIDLGISIQDIRDNCNGKLEVCGKHPLTFEPLHFIYIDFKPVLNEVDPNYGSYILKP